ncbi:MAG: hypothetical protein JWM51_1117 [Microbacteriaceae bacterium]|jgi:hypothetical protein|nr:hypothetical protein [Microbacteriaceae bacterium]
MNTSHDTETTPNEPADGSTDLTPEQKAHTESLPDGSDTDAGSSDSEQGGTSSGGPEQT